MKKCDLIRECEKRGITPSKKMGQNFLLDDNFLNCIVREARLRPGDRILEVGPGFGVLTARMLEAGATVTAIELDRKLAAYLREILVPRGLVLVEGDACRTDLPALMGTTGDYRLISNLPYSAGTVVVANLLELENPPVDLLLLLQKEVAERFAARPDTEAYSALSIRIQTLYQPEIVRHIPPEVFYPRPEVDSCLIRLTRKPDAPPPERRALIGKLVRTAFAQRRKKMLKQVAAVFGREQTEAALRAVGIDPDIRAEKVTLPQFKALAEFLATPRAGAQ